MSANDEAVDLAVVGGGLGGIACALRAIQLGLRVTLLEGSEDPAGWSNSRMSGARYHAAGLHPLRPVTEILAKAAAETEGTGDATATRAWAEACAPSYRWLRQQGVRFAVLRNVPVMAPIRPNRRGEVWSGYGADVAVRRLHARFRAMGGQTLLGHRATDLKRDADGSWVVGVLGHRPITARAVALADGGFQSNLEMLRTLAKVPRPELLVQRGAATGRGSGLQMAVEAGADVVSPEALYAHLIHRAGKDSAELRYYPMLDALAKGSFVVDATGRRIGDEHLGGIAIANKVARLEDPLGAWVIFDRERWETVGRTNQIVPPNPSLLIAGARIERAWTSADLARLIGADADRLAEGLPIGEGTAPGSGLTPPLFAIPMAVGLTFTMGGVAVGAHADVLDDQRRPLPSLYSIGATSGGLSGGPKPGYVGGISIAVVQGLLAADHAARVRTGARA
jgi:fumarate reductase flavoprotein subunit